MDWLVMPSLAVQTELFDRNRRERLIGWVPHTVVALDFSATESYVAHHC